MYEHAAKFLVFRGGALGDFILTLPVLSAIKTHWPKGSIDIAGYPHIAHLAVAGGVAERVHNIDRAGFARLFIPGGVPDADLVEFIRSFDVVLSYLYDPEGIVQENLETAGAREVLSGSPKVEGVHAVEALLKPLEKLAVYPENAAPGLELTGDPAAFGRTWMREQSLEKVLAIHPGSGSPKKNWPIERFLHVATRLRAESRFNPVLVLGEADHAIESEVRRSGFPLVSGVNLVELASILASCSAYLGNDSGVSHLASALGLPSTVLFGPTDANQWGPRGKATHIVKAPGGNLGELEVDRVLECIACGESLS